VDVRLGRPRLDARPDAPDRVALGDHPAPFDEQRAQLRQRHGIAVGGADRDDEAVPRHAAREGHLARGRSDDPSAERVGDVDAAVLSAGVRVRAEAERLQHLAAGRPAPRGGRRGDHEARSDQHRRQTDTRHANGSFSLLSLWTTTSA
jgi:hypothetical protein